VEHQDRPPTYAKEDRILRKLSAADPAWIHSRGTGALGGSGEPVLVTEFAEGSTLKEKQAPRGVGKAVRITTRVLRAIAAGHRLGYGGHDLNLGNEILKDERSRSIRLFDTGTVRERIDATVIADDVKRSGVLLLNLLVDANLRGHPIPERLGRIGDPGLRDVVRGAVNGRYATTAGLEAALRPFSWR
jgi:hypothetical protein